ncbi:MAG: ribonuclease Z [Candidatus Competibacteraceae bacterium]|nr:ribonuclease Z [Candidatus Competibacteraceae bacterium]
MKLTFLGSGSFFTQEGNFHSNLLLDSGDGSSLLIDCGTDIRWSLKAAGRSFKEIDAVYISHLHADHAGGLEWFGFANYFSQPQRHPSLFIHESYAEGLWEYLREGMETLSEKQATLESYFDVKPVSHRFRWSTANFRLVPAVHVVNNAIGHLYSYGLSMTINGVRIFLTTDVGMSDLPLADGDWDLDAFWKEYEKADLIFHDCQTQGKSDVHPSYDILKGLPENIRQKTWLYHYQDGPLPPATEDGFLGFVNRGDAFEF